MAVAGLLREAAKDKKVPFEIVSAGIDALAVKRGVESDEAIKQVADLTTHVIERADEEPVTLDRFTSAENVSGELENYMRTGEYSNKNGVLHLVAASVALQKIASHLEMET